MPPLRVLAVPTYTALLLLGACDSAVSCTKEIRNAFDVEVTSPEGLPVDRLTAERRDERWCGHSVDDGGMHYVCTEQGGGRYTVRVYSGQYVFTKYIDVAEESDGCHVTRDARLVSFVLTSAGADP